MKTFILGFFCLFPFFLLAQNPVCSPWEKVLTSENLPPQVHLQKSCNNLDLIAYQGAYYLAFRTAPSHFASKKTRLYILKTQDFKTWDYEFEIHVGADMREPRWAILKDSLYLYFFKGGTHPLKFEPKEIFVCKKEKNSWTAPQNIGLDFYVPWRIRNHQDTLYLSAYYGKDLYKSDHQAELRLFQSTDALHWKKISEKAQLSVKGAEEGEFVLNEKGNLWGVARLEGYGSIAFKAKYPNLAEWETRKSKHKYDSSCLFEEGGNIYLIARRNLDGEITKAPTYWSEKNQFRYNLFRYSWTKKTTALYQLDKTTLEIKHLMDLMGTGDNAFPAIASTGEKEYCVMNYSCDIQKRKKNWIFGQLSPTYIYMARLSFR